MIFNCFSGIIDFVTPQVKKIATWAIGTIVFLAVLVGVVKLISSPDTSSSVKMTPVTKNDIQTGPANAKVTLVEYADFQCPACDAYNPIVDDIMIAYKGKLNYVYRFFPLTTIHPNAQIGAQAGWAALQQKKFFEMRDVLYQNQNSWADVSDPKPTFIQYAQKLGMDENKFKADMTSSAAEKAVADEVTMGNADGVNSTPTFFINSNLIQNPSTEADFKKLIDAQLAQ